MMQQFLKWLGMKLFPKRAEPPPRPPVRVRVRPPAQRPGQAPRQSAARRPAAARPRPAARRPVAFHPELDGRIVDGGPGKNVLVRNRFVREDSGTHETLKILDESALGQDEEPGIDPYNTGRFDRAKHWETRFRK